VRQPHTSHEVAAIPAAELPFSGGENLHGVEEFSGRENVAEERQHRALDPQDDIGDRGR
jgi:hypothetical protein